MYNNSFPFTAQFQTMNIGTLGQPNVVTIQHQGTYKSRIYNWPTEKSIFFVQAKFV